jgi:toxin ParE1/3/4
MRIRWSPLATEDLFRIAEYIARENEPAAQRVAKAIYENVTQLNSFPNRGRRGRIEGTREMPVPSLPFIVVYRVAEEIVEIARIIHGAQRWPPNE